MTDDIPNPPKPVCSIDFYYDPLTGSAKYSLRKTDSTIVDPLTMYASMMLSRIDEQSDSIIQDMEKIFTPTPTNFTVH